MFVWFFLYVVTSSRFASGCYAACYLVKNTSSKALFSLKNTYACGSSQKLYQKYFWHIADLFLCLSKHSNASNSQTVEQPLRRIGALSEFSNMTFILQSATGTQRGTVYKNILLFNQNVFLDVSLKAPFFRHEEKKVKYSNECRRDRMYFSIYASCLYRLQFLLLMAEFNPPSPPRGGCSNICFTLLSAEHRCAAKVCS